MPRNPTAISALMLAGVFVFVILGACSSYTYVPCRVTVVDGETTEPIPGAEVSVGYGSWIKGGPWIAPERAEGTTDEQGAVPLHVTVNRSRGAVPFWFGRADGYHIRNDGGEGRPATNEIEQIIASGDASRTVSLTMRRWAEPGPTVRVTVPVGYRGFVRVCDPVGAPSTPEERVRFFECTADEQGSCQLPAASIFTEALVPVEYCFRFADGMELPRCSAAREGGTRLGAWPLSGVDRCAVFVIGTEHQAWAERKALWPDGVLDNSTYDRFAQRARAGPFPAHEQ